jgi:hypothetical protein
MTRWLVVGALVALPAVAEAACTWVLWVEESWIAVFKRDEKPPKWTLVGAHEEAARCERAQIVKINGLAKDKDTEIHDNLIFTRLAENLTRVTRVICIPDSIDPRGGKS